MDQAFFEMFFVFLENLSFFFDGLDFITELLHRVDLGGFEDDVDGVEICFPPGVFWWRGGVVRVVDGFAKNFEKFNDVVLVTRPVVWGGGR